MDLMSPDSILVTGASGLVGGAVVRECRKLGRTTLAPLRDELNLLDEQATRDYLQMHRPRFVVGAAAHVGGIAANMSAPVAFLDLNLRMQANLMLGAADAGVERFIFLASSCVYPRACHQPMKEIDLMTGPLEPTNESYAMAKLSGIQMARALQQEGRLESRVLVPSNIYGPGDSFDPERAHVTSALVKKFVDAKRARSQAVTVWGTGQARRELTHVSDVAAATIFALDNPQIPFISNVGTGSDVTIATLAQVICDVVQFDGEIYFDPSRPDGMPQKVLDVSVLGLLGWRALIPLEEGVRELVDTYMGKV